MTNPNYDLIEYKYVLNDEITPVFEVFGYEEIYFDYIEVIEHLLAEYEVNQK